MGTLGGIITTHLSRIPTDGGDVLHGIKKNEETYFGFGEAYFSNINEGKIKGWKLHKDMTMNLIVPSGTVKFVFFDEKFKSHKELTIGRLNYCRVTVPPKIWFAFQGLDNKYPNLVFNFANLQHDPNEVIRKEINEIFYNWS